MTLYYSQYLVTLNPKDFDKYEKFRNRYENIRTEFSHNRLLSIPQLEWREPKHLAFLRGYSAMKNESENSP